MKFREIVQKNVLTEVLDSTILDDVLWLFTDAKAYEKFKSLMQLSTDTGTLSRDISYHVRMIELLVACTMEFNIITEIKCQSLLSLDLIEKILTDENVIPFVKSAYAKFIHHCYIDTENEMKECFRPGSRNMWNIMNAYCHEVDLILKAQDKFDLANQHLPSYKRYTISTELQSYLGDVLPRVICAFVNSQYWDPRIHFNDDDHKDIFMKTLSLIIKLDRSKLVFYWEMSKFHAVCVGTRKKDAFIDTKLAKKQQVTSLYSRLWDFLSLKLRWENFLFLIQLAVNSGG